MYIKIYGDDSIIFKLNIDWIKNYGDNYLNWKWLLWFTVFIDMFEERNKISNDLTQMVWHQPKEIRRSFIPKNVH